MKGESSKCGCCSCKACPFKAEVRYDQCFSSSSSSSSCSSEYEDRYSESKDQMYYSSGKCKEPPPDPCCRIDEETLRTLISLRQKACRFINSEAEEFSTFSDATPENEGFYCGPNFMKKAKTLVDYEPESAFLRKIKENYLQKNEVQNVMAARSSNNGYMPAMCQNCVCRSKQVARLDNSSNKYRSETELKPRDSRGAGCVCNCPGKVIPPSSKRSAPPPNELKNEDRKPHPIKKSSKQERNGKENKSQSLKSVHKSRSKKRVTKIVKKQHPKKIEKAVSQDQFEPSLKRPHENSCERCWKYASSSRSPVNRPDQRYDPNFRKAHSCTEIITPKGGEGNFERHVVCKDLEPRKPSDRPESPTPKQRPHTAQLPIQKSEYSKRSKTQSQETTQKSPPYTEVTDASYESPKRTSPSPSKRGSRYNKSQSYSKENYRNETYAKENYPKENYSKENCPSKEDYPKESYSKENYPKQNYSKENYPKQNYSKENYSKENYPKQNYSKENYSKENYPKETYSKDYCFKKYAPKEGYVKETGPKENYPREAYSRERIGPRPKSVSYRKRKEYPRDDFQKDESTFRYVEKPSRINASPPRPQTASNISQRQPPKTHSSHCFRQPPSDRWIQRQPLMTNNYEEPEVRGNYYVQQPQHQPTHSRYPQPLPTAPPPPPPPPPVDYSYQRSEGPSNNYSQQRVIDPYCQRQPPPEYTHRKVNSTYQQQPPMDHYYPRQSGMYHNYYELPDATTSIYQPTSELGSRYQRYPSQSSYKKYSQKPITTYEPPGKCICSPPDHIQDQRTRSPPMTYEPSGKCSCSPPDHIQNQKIRSPMYSKSNLPANNYQSPSSPQHDPNSSNADYISRAESPKPESPKQSTHRKSSTPSSPPRPSSSPQKSQAVSPRNSSYTSQFEETQYPEFANRLQNESFHSNKSSSAYTPKPRSSTPKKASKSPKRSMSKTPSQSKNGWVSPKSSKTRKRSSTSRRSRNSSQKNLEEKNTLPTASPKSSERPQTTGSLQSTKMKSLPSKSPKAKSPKPMSPRPMSPRPMSPRPVSPRPMSPRPMSPRHESPIEEYPEEEEDYQPRMQTQPPSYMQGKVMPCPFLPEPLPRQIPMEPHPFNECKCNSRTPKQTTKGPAYCCHCNEPFPGANVNNEESFYVNPDPSFLRRAHRETFESRNTYPNEGHNYSPYNPEYTFPINDGSYRYAALEQYQNCYDEGEAQIQMQQNCYRENLRQVSERCRGKSRQYNSCNDSSAPRKYSVFYMTKSKEGEGNEVEVIVEELTQSIPHGKESKPKPALEKMKKIVEAPSESMALRFQKGVYESNDNIRTSRVLYF